jgi:hypothetical protein
MTEGEGVWPMMTSPEIAKFLNNFQEFPVILNDTPQTF